MTAFKADPQAAAWVMKTVQEIVFVSMYDPAAAMALVGAVAANTHLVLGGKLDKIEKVGDVVKASVEGSLYAARDREQTIEGKGLIV